MIKVQKRKKKIQIFPIINTTLLILFAIVCLFPFLNQLMVSFASPTDYYQADLFVIPFNFNIESYKYILFQGRIGNAFLVSLFTTAAGTLYNMILTILGAYALAKRTLPGRKIFFTFILVTMFFGGGLIPFYLTVHKLGLTDTLFAIIIPFGINSFNMIILRNFFSQVPEEVVESCKMDGANDFTILFKFIIPLSKAGLATITLFYLVERWNDWYWPMLFIDDSAIYPLALELRNILSANQSTGIGSGGNLDPGLLFIKGQESATIVIAMIPILLVYPFLQKYFVKGVMLGAVKS